MRGTVRSGNTHKSVWTGHARDGPLVRLRVTTPWPAGVAVEAVAAPLGPLLPQLPSTTTRGTPSGRPSSLAVAVGFELPGPVYGGFRCVVTRYASSQVSNAAPLAHRGARRFATPAVLSMQLVQCIPNLRVRRLRRDPRVQDHHKPSPSFCTHAESSNASQPITTSPSSALRPRRAYGLRCRTARRWTRASPRTLASLSARSEPTRGTGLPTAAPGRHRRRETGKSRLAD